MERTQHIFVCWDHRYCPETIEQHREIIRREGSVFWGKFTEQRFRQFKKDLEPIDDGPLGSRAEFLETIISQLNQGIETHLYVCDPDPALFSLHVALLTNINYSPDGEPPGGVEAYHLIPQYYFEDSSKSQLAFGGSYWFQIQNDLVPLDASYLWQLTDLSEENNTRQLRFSIANFYPMPVAVSDESMRFKVDGDPTSNSDWPPRPPKRIRDKAPRLSKKWRVDHVPKSTRDLLNQILKSDYITGIRYLSAFDPIGEGWWFKEITDSGDIVCIYSSDWSVKFLIENTAECRAEGFWIWDRI